MKTRFYQNYEIYHHLKWDERCACLVGHVGLWYAMSTPHGVSRICGQEGSRLGGSPLFLFSQTVDLYHRLQERSYGKRVSEKDLREKGCQNMKGPSPRHMPYSHSKEIVGYQPINFFCNFENSTLVSPFVKRSPNWLMVSILTSSIWRGPICSLNQWYFIV
jgi:hypothetical protein